MNHQDDAAQDAFDAGVKHALSWKPLSTNNCPKNECIVALRKDILNKSYYGIGKFTKECLGKWSWWIYLGELDEK